MQRTAGWNRELVGEAAGRAHAPDLPNSHKPRLMRDLAPGCVFGTIGRNACPDLTNSGKLLSRLVGGICWPPERQYFLGHLWPSFAHYLGPTLRVKNAGCLENIAVESAEL